MTPDPQYFISILDQWADEHPRPLPWKGEADPYKIWISEVILQQTKVETGVSYYSRFLSAFPSLQELAAAQEEEVLKAWEGMGYYSRARNLHKAANQIVENFDGQFPTSYADLLSLKGVGEYTAAAVASFAFDKQYPAIDGNVKRVLSRIFGVKSILGTRAHDQKMHEIAHSLLQYAKAARVNQQLIDFGAITCKPRNPDCRACPFSTVCYAYIHEYVGRLPKRRKKKKKRKRFFNYIFFREERGKVMIRRRDNNDIWAGLYEPYLIETSELTPMTKILREKISSEFSAPEKVESRKQLLTHQVIHLQIAIVEMEDGFINPKGAIFVPPMELSKYPFPVPLSQYIYKNLSKFILTETTANDK